MSLVVGDRLLVADSSRRLSVSQQTLRNGAKKYRNDRRISSGCRSVSDLEAEVSKLRKELAENLREKEILKKVMAYLARAPPGGTR